MKEAALSPGKQRGISKGGMYGIVSWTSSRSELAIGTFSPKHFPTLVARSVMQKSLRTINIIVQILLTSAPPCERVAMKWYIMKLGRERKRNRDGYRRWL